MRHTICFIRLPVQNREPFFIAFAPGVWGNADDAGWCIAFQMLCTGEKL